MIDSIIKDNFIKYLTNILNEENERRVYDKKNILNVSFIVSVIDKKIAECTSFIKDISSYDYNIFYYEDKSSGYTNGNIAITIMQKDDQFYPGAFCNYHYEIDFLYDDRMWGYCMCSHSDEHYNKEHKCCGFGCDWSAPAFSIKKITSLGQYSWDGCEADYWNYEKTFKSNNENEIQSVKEYEKEQKKQRIQNRIEELQEELKNI